MNKKVKLNSICEILDNKRIPLSDNERQKRIKNKKIDVLYPYYGATKQVGYIDDYIFDDELILLGEDGVMFYDISKPKAYLIKGKSWVNNHAHVLKINNTKANTNYVLYYLNIFNYQGYVSGSTRLKLNKSKMSEISIPLPTLEKQNQIAKTLDKANELVELRKESITKLDALAKSIFIDMFGDPVINPKKWKMTICINEANCIVPGRDKPKSFTGRLKWVTTGDLKDRRILLTKEVLLGLNSKEITEVKAKIIPKDSVIFTCVGDLGVVSIIDEDIVMNQQLHSFQCKENLNNIFLMFNISYQKPYMYKFASQTTVPYMNKTTCNNIPLILPPLDLQNKFAKIIEKIEEQKVLYTQELEKLQINFDALLQKSFQE